MKQITLPRPTERPTMLGAGGPVPEFEALAWNPDPSSTVEKNTFKISDYKGKKIVVLDLWATWCGPCMAGIPHISKIAEEVKGQGVEVIALNVWDEQAAFERFAKEKGKDYAFKLARDPAGKEKDASIATRLFKLPGIPATYVIDKNGKIEAAVSGYNKDDKQIEHALVRLGVKIEGIKPEDAKKAEATKGEGKTVPMVPATGMK
jgi:thiol-disulfide isomerase/thioredoxin